MSEPKTAEVKVVPFGWRTMESAPKDRTPVRALIHADLYPRVKPGRDDLVRWNGQEIVVHHPGIADDGFGTGWSLSAPVGHGGFPDEWFVGWLPTGLAASPPAETGEGFTSLDGLWKDLSLTRLERVKAHRSEFGSDLKTALEAVDEEGERQRIALRATHPASDQSDTERMRAEVREAITTLAMLKRNVNSEIAKHDGLFRWEGVPEAIQARIDALSAALAEKAAGQSAANGEA